MGLVLPATWPRRTAPLALSNERTYSNTVGKCNENECSVEQQFSFYHPLLNLIRLMPPL